MKPFMPPSNDFQIYLEQIWESRQLTNSGPIHGVFERALCDYLGVKYISLLANGTLALIIALKVIDLKGEIITTPFTSVATAQSIYWNNLTPVFVDIGRSDFNIDISEIERAVTPKTSAILPVHLFGNPCNVDAINQLAQKYNLKVIYDAAHCFGVELNRQSILNYGDLSVVSFHATKVFNTFEGGAIICRDKITKTYIDNLINTGLDADRNLTGYGLNAKMNELQAGFGLVQLKYIDEVIALRKAATSKYKELLKEIKGLRIVNESEFVKYNYTYFPIIINPVEFGTSRDEVVDFLEKRKIFPRKYFYPLVSDFPPFSIYKTNELPVAKEIAENIICLPLFHDISIDEITYVVDAIRGASSRQMHPIYKKE